MKVIVTTLSALALASTLSFAEDKPARPPGGPGGEARHERPSPEEVFKKLDADANGSISLEEFKAGPRGQADPAKAAEIFKTIDTDGNGSISLEEFKAHRPHGGPAHHRQGGPGGPGKGPGGPAGEKPPAGA